MNENQFYALCWKIVATCVIVLILTIGGCEAYTRSLVADAIKSGADPLKVACAINGSSGTNTICAIQAAKP